MLNSIINNLEFLEIETANKTIDEIIEKLAKEEKHQGLALETILKIKLYPGELEKEIKNGI